MKYIDMHCDTVTVCFDGGLNLRDCDLQISAEKLNRSDCAAQCFALFTQGDGAALRFGQYLGFYSAAAPDKPPYVQMGSQVKAGDVLFIVESMKLMNEVQSEFSGTVEEILVQNGQPVEYGQPIMRIV